MAMAMMRQAMKNPNNTFSLLGLSFATRSYGFDGVLHSQLITKQLVNYSNHRFFSDSSSDLPSNIAFIKSAKDFQTAFKKVQDDAFPAIFYYTAVWCGPCKFISPIVESLSKQHPHVTTYKIDIDQEELAQTLSEVSVTAVPTFHFYKNGKKVDEILGADERRLRSTIEALYN